MPVCQFDSCPKSTRIPPAIANSTVLFPPSHKSNSSSRVVITGAGIVTALGQGWKPNAEGFRSGRQVFRPVTLFDVSRQRVKLAAEVSGPLALPETRLGARELARLDRAGKLLLLAAYQAWQQSSWTQGEDLPIVLGTTAGGMSLGEAFYRETLAQPYARRRQPSRVVHYQPQRQALNLADAFGCSGPITIIANACASGANAIGHAFELVRS